MKILHLMLSQFYIDNAAYQENIIPLINKNDGHTVEILASREVFVNQNMLGLTNPGIYYSEAGIKITRLPYVKIFNNFISKKVRAYSKLYDKIAEFNPDVIFFHGGAAWALNTIARYKKKNTHVRFYVDSHEDKNNSARNPISSFLLYDCFYSPILRRNMKYIDKLFYITKETYNFIKDIYKVNDDKLAFLPLGGLIPSEEEKLINRKEIRDELGINEDEILCLHSGKLDKLKRSIEIVEGFSNCKNPDFKLVIIGVVEKEIEPELLYLIEKDDRIKFLGWKSSSELQKYLMAGDLYIQLGSQSVTMQQALCNGCAVAVYPHESHRFLLKDNAYYIESSRDLTELLSDININKIGFQRKKEESFNFAKKALDYNIISKTILEN